MKRKDATAAIVLVRKGKEQQQQQSSCLIVTLPRRAERVNVVIDVFIETVA
jgi:hypothetical protein